MYRKPTTTPQQQCLSVWGGLSLPTIPLDRSTLSLCALLVRAAHSDGDNDDEGNNNTKFLECVLCAQDTVSALHGGHSSQLPCETGTVIFPIS